PHPPLYSFPTRRSSDLPDRKLRGKAQIRPRARDTDKASCLSESSPARDQTDASSPNRASPADDRARSKCSSSCGQTFPLATSVRSEEHTSELQSRSDLV